MNEPIWEDKCWGCGRSGDHPVLGPHYWPCETMKSASIRGEACYETEIAALRAQMDEKDNLLTRLRPMLKSISDGYSQKQRFLMVTEARRFLLVPGWPADKEGGDETIRNPYREVLHKRQGESP